MNKKIGIKTGAFICILLLTFLAGLVVSFVGINLSGRFVVVEKNYFDSVAVMGEKYGRLEGLYDVIDNKYYGEYTDESLMTGVYKGLFSSLDKYSSYMTADEFETFAAASTGSFFGIGVVISVTDSDEIIVLSTLDDAPAAKAGMKAGDIILEIDDEKYQGSQLDVAAAKLRGSAGTKVKVKYIRNGEPIEVTIKRDKIVNDSVYSEAIENGDIGYIRIAAFELATEDDFKNAVKDMERAGVKGLIIDLRNNGGGIMDSSIGIADYLLPASTIISTMDSEGNEDFINSEASCIALPYVLLINENSASASEILAAAVKENKGGELIGKTTFGKGVIQEVFQLSKDGDAIKITIQEYFGPNKAKINGVGISPDYEVDLVENEDVDYQLEKAVEVLLKKME